MNRLVPRHFHRNHTHLISQSAHRMECNQMLLTNPLIQHQQYNCCQVWSSSFQGVLSKHVAYRMLFCTYSQVPSTRGVLINGGWEPSKKLINGLNKWGGQKFAKNRFLRYLLETSAFYMLRTLQVFKKQM